MKVALLQLNARLGDPEGNGRRVEAAYGEALQAGAELVLAPELVLPGYLAEDRLWEPALRRRVEAESLRLAALAGPVPLGFGTARPAPSGRLWNELWWCESGRLRHCARKRVLPSYDVFDEHRYFEPDLSPQPLVAFGGQRIGLSICEDLWADPQLGNSPVSYGVDPIADLAAAGATLILNASASPSALGSWLPPGRTAPWAIPSKDAQRERLLPSPTPAAWGPRAGCSSMAAPGWRRRMAPGRARSPSPRARSWWIPAAPAAPGAPFPMGLGCAGPWSRDCGTTWPSRAWRRWCWASRAASPATRAPSWCANCSATARRCRS